MDILSVINGTVNTIFMITYHLKFAIFFTFVQYYLNRF